MTPTVAELNYQSLILKAKEYEAAFRLGEKPNSRSKSKRRKNKDGEWGTGGLVSTN